MVARYKPKLVAPDAPTEMPTETVTAEALTEAPVVSAELARVSEALALLPCSSAMGAEQWAQIVNAVWCASGGTEDGFRAAEAWSRSWFFYSVDDLRKRWDGCAKSPPADTDADTLFAMAGKVAEREKVLAEAARLSDSDYEDRRKALAKSLGGWRTPQLDRERERRRKKAKASGPAAPPPPTIEQLAAAAKDIIADTEVLERFADSIAATLAGEVQSAKLIYLCATSRLFTKPMNLVIKGLSSIGKSHLRECVFSFVPPEDIVAFTTLTEKALIYLPGSLSHKILSMAEAVGSREHELQDYLIREIISEGKITHFVPVKGGPGELPETQKKVVEGPIMFTTTTTRARLHPEIETRILSIETDDTERQTRRVLEKVAEIEGGIASEPIDYAPWLAYQRWLAAGERRVTIPFAMTLARHPDTYIKGIRMRRDFRQVLAAVQAHALLHRDHRARDAMGRIVASIEDYEVIHRLMANRLAQGAGVQLKANDARVLKAVKEAQLDSDDPTKGVTVQTLVRALDLDQTTINRRLHKLASLSFVENLTPGKGRTARWQANAAPDSIDVLPDADALAEAWKERSKK